MVKVNDVAYVRYGVSDLDKTEKFFSDFGLVRVSRSDNLLLMRGTGARPYCYVAEKSDKPGFRAIGLTTNEDLREATKIEGASGVENLDWTGGGQRVRVTSPAGVNYEIVSGIALAKALPLRPALVLNPGSSKPRQNKTQRPPRGAAEIIRLGHCALNVPDTMGEIAWVTKNFGMLVSDYLTDPETKQPIAAFLRMDRGSEATDHHSIAIFPSEKTNIHHCSFEIEDLDALYLGNAHLLQNGHQHHWGIGRHVLGSQLFDYWFDPDGNRIEHYTDGDVMDVTHVPGYVEATEESLSAWAPPLPAGFIG